MKSLREIQTEIGALTAEERAALLAWLLDDVDSQVRKGNFRPME
jgi:hypothetical protein